MEANDKAREGRLAEMLKGRRPFKDQLPRKISENKIALVIATGSTSDWPLRSMSDIIVAVPSPPDYGNKRWLDQGATFTVEFPIASESQVDELRDLETDLTMH
jgi:hypothetical protein